MAAVAVEEMAVPPVVVEPFVPAGVKLTVLFVPAGIKLTVPFVPAGVKLTVPLLPLGVPALTAEVVTDPPTNVG